MTAPAIVRALVVEDSATARELLAGILGADPGIRVVGLARDGVEAVEMTGALRPDVVTMDAGMPRMDGFEATKRIMVEAPTPIVIVSATLDTREVAVSMRALEAGALVVLDKPAGPGAPDFEEASRRFVRTVKAMSQVKVVRRWPERPPERRPRAAPRGAARTPVRAVAIAASTGGPAAVRRLLSALPGRFPAPILVVQHMARGFVAGLAAWLDAGSLLRVKVAEHGEPLAPGTVYLAADDRHLGASSLATAVLSDAPPVGGFRPSGSVLFESVAAAFGPSAMALVLTGMGQDGVKGLRALRKAGGRVIAQDERSSVVFGMPGAAIAAGLADLALPLDAIAPRLIEMVRGAERSGP